jgi:hypothetical protein
VSERGVIGVTAFSVEEERQPLRFGLDMGVRWDRTTYKASVELVLDDAGLDRFLDAMEAAVPGFSRGHRRRSTESPALPETTRALPVGPIDAEFVDE